MKNQNFGVEIELTGITRKRAAEVIADYFGTHAGKLKAYIQFCLAVNNQALT